MNESFAASRKTRSSIDSVVHSLYAAVGNDAAWDDVVAAIARELDARIGMLVVMGKGQRDQSFYAAWNHREEVARAYSDHWWQHDVPLNVAVRRGMFVRGMIARISDIVPGEILRATPYYRDFMLTMPADYGIACVLSDGSDPLLGPPMHLSLFRHPGQPDFSDDDVARLTLLYPHLHRAFELHWQFRHLAEQVAVFHQSLDGLDFGVVFVDAAQKVRHANACAYRLGAHGPRERLLDGLPATVPSTGKLADLLQACALGTGGAAALGEGAGRLLALAMPLAAPRSGIGGDIRGSVMLMLIDPAQKPGAALDFLVRAFGLSKAQARLLPLLLDDLKPAEMAAALDLKITTVRSQLSAIYAKTGTTRQQELIRLLGTMPAIRYGMPSH